MQTNKNGKLYAAFKAKDMRFDGRIFIGISSTGIYCRPVCRAKMPLEKNCTFYRSAAEAEQAGYRPCLLCRPELAPGIAIVDATASLAQKAMRFLEENCGSGENLESIAEKLGCTGRHLRRAFTAEYNVSPVQYLQTCRLLLAKSLLTDTNLSVLEVAMAAGFGSLRRFNDLFKKKYNLSPVALRKQAKEDKKIKSNITINLSYHPPYKWQEILDFLKQRAIFGVETVQDGQYSRTVSIISPRQKQLYGWIQVKDYPDKNALSVTIAASLLPALPQVLSHIRQLFDLRCDPHIIYESLSQMNDIRPGLYSPGTRLPGCFDAFEMAVRAVLGQQITVKAACTLAARMAQKYGTPVETEIKGLTHTFPSCNDILNLPGTIGDNLGPLGIIGTRAKTILELAKAFANADIHFDICARPDVEIKKLKAIPGIGNWTAEYIAMRAMGWPDAFLETDAGIKKALSPLTAKEMLKLAESWRPWRSYATISLWNSL